ncbi:Id [Apostichopus japonicus]|uniref:Id n=1 Tax=Stichopus japonicus TaxID=307972 RepID=A0A2G8K296_STIJA|nr:Id [Apostichopus japonicus]
MKVTRQVNMEASCHGQQHKIATMLHRAQSLSKHRSSLNDFSMSDCYEKLIEIVPTIPRDRKVSRVEILQHVIDYIQDLQIALDHQNIRVRNINEPSGHTTLVTTPNRTPFSTLQTTSSSGSTQIPFIVTSSETSSLNREFVKQVTPFRYNKNMLKCVNGAI